MSVCGRCRSRGTIHQLRGIGERPCPVCKGSGVKLQGHALGARTVSVPLPAGARCKVCGDPAVHFHHVVAQQRIDRFLNEDIRQRAKADKRNLVALCFDCHEAVEKALMQLRPADLPTGFQAFVSDYDLAAALPRHLAGYGAASEAA